MHEYSRNIPGVQSCHPQCNVVLGITAEVSFFSSCISEWLEFIFFLMSHSPLPFHLLCLYLASLMLLMLQLQVDLMRYLCSVSYIQVIFRAFLSFTNLESERKWLIGPREPYFPRYMSVCSESWVQGSADQYTMLHFWSYILYPTCSLLSSWKLSSNFQCLEFLL